MNNKKLELLKKKITMVALAASLGLSYGTVAQADTYKKNEKNSKETFMLPVNETKSVGIPNKNVCIYTDSDEYLIKLNIEQKKCFITLMEENISKKSQSEILEFLNKYNETIYSLDIDANCYITNNKREVRKVDEAFLKKMVTLDNLQDLDLHRIKNLDISIFRDIPVKSLFLGGCTFYDCKKFSELSQLETLSLFSCEISDIKSITSLSQLTQLNIFDTAQYDKPLENIQDIKNMTSLKILRLSGNKIKSIEALSNLQSLQTLDLSMNEISDITPLSKLNQLKYVNLNYNVIKSIKSLIGLQELHEIWLNENPIIDLSVLKDMKATPKIYLNDEADLNDLKSCIEELTEKDFMIYDEDLNCITKEYFEKQEELQLKLNK